MSTNYEMNLSISKIERLSNGLPQWIASMDCLNGLLQWISRPDENSLKMKFEDDYWVVG